jgi:dTDP-4-dehydrorhamnose reductase
VPLGREEVDLADERFAELLKECPFDLLINAAAVTNVDWCESNPDRARMVNAVAPGILAELCARRGGRLVQISTDYVFDGRAERPYRESDGPNPLSVYGRTKHEGERRVLAVDPGNLVVRVSWLFGPDKGSFIDQILHRAIQEENVGAIADKFSTPTFTLDLADWLVPLLFDRPATGVLHAANAGGCSWLEYGQRAIDVAASLGISLRTRQLRPIKLEAMAQFVAARPRYTVMDTARLSDLLGIQLLAWQDAVTRYVRDFASRRL